MRTELETIKKEFNERIDALILKNSDRPTPPKEEFEVGKWYKHTSGSVANFQGNNNAFGIRNNAWCSLHSGWTFSSHSFNWTLMTESEVKEAIEKECLKRGYKFGNFKCLFHDTIGENHIHPCYSFTEDRLWIEGGCPYYNGKWAEIIKDSPIKIGGYEVKIHKTVGKTEASDCTTIDNNVFTKEFWQSALKISEHSKAKIMIGCSKQFDVSIEVIKAILEKLK